MWLDRHRVDDVGCDQEFEPEQDRPTHARPVVRIGLRASTASLEFSEVSERSSEQADNDNRDAADLDQPCGRVQRGDKPLVHLHPIHDSRTSKHTRRRRETSRTVPAIEGLRKLL